VLAVALLTPEAVGNSGDSRLTTESRGAYGAALFYELSQRLGWHVKRWSGGPVPPHDPRAVFAVLYPEQAPSATETHQLLQHVREGGALLYVAGLENPLDDSLRVRRSRYGGLYQPVRTASVASPLPPPADSAAADKVFADSLAAADSAAAKDSLARADSIARADSLEELERKRLHAEDSARRARGSAGADTAADTTSEEESEEEEADSTPKLTDSTCAPESRSRLDLHRFFPDSRVRVYRLEWRRRRPTDLVVFADQKLEPYSYRRGRDTIGAAAVGYSYGRGRIVVLSDPDMLRNDVLRVCNWGLDVVAINMLEYLSGGGELRRDRIVFDEYHQGFGPHPGTFRAIALFFSRSSAGHLLAQALGGGLVLLMALGPRALPPRNQTRIERRSPLEHVTALARAYAQVNASRTATERLLRGVRRRVERAAPWRGEAAESGKRELTDNAFLDLTTRSFPALNADAEIIRRALGRPVSRQDLENVGAALRRLETTLTPRR
jgi:hypothetical protein